MRIEKPEQKILETFEVKESFRVKTKDGNFILDEGDTLQVVEANGMELTEDVQVPAENSEITILEAGDFINVLEKEDYDDEDGEVPGEQDTGPDEYDEGKDKDDDDEEMDEKGKYKNKKESTRSRRRRVKESHLSGAIQDEIVTSLIEAMVDKGGMYAASEMNIVFKELNYEYYDMIGTTDYLKEFYEQMALLCEDFARKI
jgi:DNA-directed RNA polymerase specialized sigma54-like protein